MTIRVNRVLSKKQNIAGIPADIFIPILAFDVLAGILLCLVFSVSPMPVAFFCLIVNVVWAILVAKGVWRFMGTFYHPPRYYRQNIRYIPFLQQLLEHDNRPQHQTKKRRAITRKGQRKGRTTRN
jgi:hypothetical protein